MSVIQPHFLPTPERRRQSFQRKTRYRKTLEPSVVRYSNETIVHLESRIRFLYSTAAVHLTSPRTYRSVRRALVLINFTSPSHRRKGFFFIQKLVSTQ